MIFFEEKRKASVAFYARTFGFSQEDARICMTNGPSVSLPFELMANGMSFGGKKYKKYNHQNHPASADGEWDGKLIGQRNLTRNGIIFLDSKYQGVKRYEGRKKNRVNLIKSLSNKRCTLVCDIRNPPTIKFMMVDNHWLLQKVQEGCLAPSGWTAKKFYSMIDEIRNLNV